MNGDRTHIDLTTRVQRNEDVVTANVDDEIMALSVEMGSYYGFRKSGVRIWEFLGDIKTVAEICDALRAEYDVDEETCERDVIEFLEQLADEKLIHIVD